MEKDSLLDFLNEMYSSISVESKGETESPLSKENIIPNERVAFLLFPFFIDLIEQFKDTLKNLRNYARIFQEKFRDQEFLTYLNRIITDDIKKIELLQTSLLNYIKINTPIIRTNTVNIIVEEELKKYQAELEEKKIRLFKTLEKDLPETAIPDDQLRYILSCALQYVTTLIPTNGTIGLFTRSHILQRETGEDQGGRYVEILMVYTGYSTSMDQFGTPFGIPARQKDGILDLALRFVDEIVQRNRGMMKFEVDEKKTKTSISLRFPTERRKVVYYQSAKELSARMRQSKTTFEKLSSLGEMKKGG